MLQEAQHCAIQLEREKGKEKKKTYQGNARMTCYRCEKARKELASQGFLDLASFMALKRGRADRARYGGPNFDIENTFKGQSIDPMPPQ